MQDLAAALPAGISGLYYVLIVTDAR